jgi:uridylate kinase
LNFKKAVKTSINAAIPDAETAVADTVTAATNTVDGLFTGDKKLKACTKSLVKT